VGPPEQRQCWNYMTSLKISKGFVVNFPKEGMITETMQKKTAKWDAKTRTRAAKITVLPVSEEVIRQLELERD